MHVAVGFMPAFKYLQKNSSIVLERGRKARGYESAVDSPKTQMGCPPLQILTTVPSNLVNVNPLKSSL
ncbi:MAG: hypothetical protein DMG11_11535 [Acidobacteria bacterium]|nr:MAG: hypothetical protein DMG11_11535 [Acidobacteriota bacterium]